MNINSHRHDQLGRRLGGAAASLVLAGAELTSVQSASAVTVVPPGCGRWSGQLVPEGWDYEDHSADTTAVNVVLSNSTEVFYIGTAFGDTIQAGTTQNIICGLGGDDTLLGGDDVDELYGGDGVDTLSGQTASDFLSGGARADVLYGDDVANANIFDTGDELQGGDGNDDFYGGRGTDTIRGGGGAWDWADGQDGADSCSANTEFGPC